MSTNTAQNSNLNRKIAYAAARAESEHRIAVRENKGRLAAQKRVAELEEVVRDARHWMRENPDVEVPEELRRIIRRAGVVANSYRLANTSKADD